MSRYDKYDPVSGGFRAKLAAAVVTAKVSVIQAVSVNASGQAAIGGTTLDLIRGVICPVRTMAAGEVIDVMTAGEIVEITTTAGVAFSAGNVLYAHADGTVDATATAGLPIGQVIEADRVVIRLALSAALKLEDLADVNLAGAANGQQLTYVAAAAADSKWQPGASGV